MNLEHLLDIAKNGQWSVDDFDWKTPVMGIDKVSKANRKRIGQMLLFTAGVERLGLTGFMLSAKHTPDKTAKAVFMLNAFDEERHAEAETLLARRLGVEWHDLPWVVRVMFKNLHEDFRRAARGRNGRQVFELVNRQIVIAELALDAILIPTLKKILDDPLQTEVFRLIDKDEARHLTMDYWTLEYEANRLREGGRDSIADSVDVFRPQTLALLVAGFLRIFWTTRTLPVSGDDFKAYWARVQAVPSRAEGAMDIPTYRATFEQLSKVVEFFEERPDLLRRVSTLGHTLRG